MKNLTESLAVDWPSGYRAGETLKDYIAQPGTIKILGPEFVTELWHSVKTTSPNGGIGSGGLNYLRDPTGDEYAVVLSSHSDKDILHIPKVGKWQGIKEIKKGRDHMKVFVLPSKGVLRDNPFAQGAEFRLV